MQTFLFPCIRFMFFLPFHGGTKINKGKEIHSTKKTDTIDIFMGLLIFGFRASNGPLEGS